MGDRCYVRVEVRKSDLPTLYEVFGIDDNFIEQDDGDGIVAVGVQEKNYGASHELEMLAERGIPYVGWHEEGGSYSAHNFCGIGGKHYEIPVSKDGHYFLNVDETGKILERNGRRNIRAYAKAEQQARNALTSG